jgi:hypothetical protein
MARAPRKRRGAAKGTAMAVAPPLVLAMVVEAEVPEVREEEAVQAR